MGEAYCGEDVNGRIGIWGNLTFVSLTIGLILVECKVVYGDVDYL